MSSPSKNNTKKPLYCSFCGKSQRDVKKLVAGTNVFICNECVDLCVDIVKDTKEVVDKYNKSEILLKPQDIKNTLDQYIVGQDVGKKLVSVAVYNHYKRIFGKTTNLSPKLADVQVSKSNILIIGSTGTGKTLFAQTIAKIIDVPFAICDATSLTEAGYVGEDVESVITRLVQNAKYDIEKAQNGIIYIDEIDKISRKGDGPSTTRDVSGEGVQQALLKLMEGTTISILPQGSRKTPNQEMLQIDTKNILFIVGGSFADIDKIVIRRLSHNASIGFGACVVNKEKREDFNISENIKDEDVIKYGLIPEFVGRLPVLISLHDLNEDHLYKILIEPKNSLISQYQKLFAIDNINLTFTDCAIRQIAHLAIEKKVGARGLRGIVENALQDIMYSSPNDKDIIAILIDKDVILKTGTPKITKKSNISVDLKPQLADMKKNILQQNNNISESKAINTKFNHTKSNLKEKPDNNTNK